MSWLDAIRLALVAANTALFAWLSVSTLMRARRITSPGTRRLQYAYAAASGAVVMGGIQRLVLQGIHLNAVPASALVVVLEEQALVQAILVAVIGLWAWRSIRRAEHDVMTAESLLAAFGGELADIDWSNVTLTRRQEQVMALIERGIVADTDLADELGVSVETIRSHVKAVMKEVGVSSRLELAVALHRRNVAA